MSSRNLIAHPVVFEKTYTCSVSLVNEVDEDSGEEQDMSVETLKLSYEACLRGKNEEEKQRFTKDYAYTTAFINVLNMLYHLLNHVQYGQNNIKINSSTTSMIDLFDPDTNVTSIQFETETKVNVAITNCFNLLNEMIKHKETRDHLFPNKKQMKPKEDATPPVNLNPELLERAIEALKATYNAKLAQSYTVDDVHFQQYLIGENITQPTLGHRYQYDSAKAADGKYTYTMQLLEKDHKRMPTVVDKMKYFVDLKRDYSRFMEEYGNALRVYVRVKGGTVRNVGLNVNSDSITCKPPFDDIKTYTKQNFAKVFDSDTTTESVYNQLDEDDLFTRVKHGLNTVVFGYGYSGSGKTYTLLEENEGLLFRFMKANEDNKNVRITLHSIFEIYRGKGFTKKYESKDVDKKFYDEYKHDEIRCDAEVIHYVPYGTKPNDDIKDTSYAGFSTVDALYSQYKQLIDKFRSERKKIIERNQQILKERQVIIDQNKRRNPKLADAQLNLDEAKELAENLDYQKMVDTIYEKYNKLQVASTLSISNIISAIMEVINVKRKYENRIMETANNPESSRGHLFIVLRADYADGSGQSGFLTFVDMAGREDPLDIIHRQFKNMQNYGTMYSVFRLLHNEKTIKEIRELITKKANESNANASDYKRLMSYIENVPPTIKTPDELLKNLGFDQAGSHFSTVISGNTLLYQSIYINESINHLKSLFLRRLYTNVLQPVPNRIGYDTTFRSQSTYSPDMVMELPERIYTMDATYNLKLLSTKPINIEEDGKKDLSQYTFKKIVLPDELDNKQFIMFTSSMTFIRKNVGGVFIDYQIDKNEKHDDKITSLFQTTGNPNIAKNVKTLRADYDKGIKDVNMITTLEKLSRLGSGKTKFVMMCCVRREAEYCEDTSKTLIFANEISSFSTKDDIEAMHNDNKYNSPLDTKRKITASLKSITLNPQVYGAKGGGVRKHRKKNIAKSQRAR